MSTGAAGVIVVCGGCGQRLRLPEARLVDEPRCPKCKTRVFSGSPLALDDRSFDRFIGGTELPVLLDFWAAWCGPCRSLAPVIECAARVLIPRVLVAKVNTDESPLTAGRLGIRSIPTLVLVRDGREVARQAGTMPFDALLGWLAKGGIRCDATGGDRAA